MSQVRVSAISSDGKVLESIVGDDQGELVQNIIYVMGTWSDQVEFSVEVATEDSPEPISPKIKYVA